MATLRSWFGRRRLESYAMVLKSGNGGTVGVPVALMVWNNFITSHGHRHVEDLDTRPLGRCHCLFSFSFQNILFLDNFCNLDAAGGDAHFTNI